MERIWSDQQQAIFEVFGNGTGNLIVRARAGTGKTTTLVKACEFVPQSAKILLAAFNKKIATELTSRIKSGNIDAKTLHALGFAYIRATWRGIVVDDSVDFDRARQACDKQAPDEVLAIVKNLASKLKGIAPLTYDVKEVIDIAQRFDLVPSEEHEAEGWTLERVARCAGKARDAALDQDPAGRISFDDMVYIPVGLGIVTPRYDMVVVDEAQDMNAAQLLLARGACRKSGRIIVVGDDRQAIYGFRGADAGGIDRLKAELSAKELGLTVTYRCGKNIVEVARAIVPDFVAHSSNADGLVDSIAYDAVYNQAKPGDFVLSRKNAPLMGLCLGFLKRGVRARIEGRDLGKALAAIVSGFKAKSVPHYLEKVAAWGEKASKRASKIGKEDLRASKLAEVTDQVDVLVAISEGCANVAEILTRCESLFGDDNGTTPAHVVLSSVHKAKGLEANRVFVVADTVSEKSCEEANIKYVAVTRAKRHLTWLVKAA